MTARPVFSLAALGIALRMADYLGDRTYWLDEASLMRNITGRPADDLFATMTGTQLVPAGFLAVEVWLSKLLGPGRMALRLFPVVCGVGSVFGFVSLSGRVLTDSRFGRLTALAVFAAAGDLIYYSSELKPYSTDVAGAVFLTLAGVAAVSDPKGPTPLGLLGLAAMGSLAVWLSFPTALVLGGVGAVLFMSAVGRGDRRGAAAVAGVCLCWLLSFAGAYVVARRLLGVGGAEAMGAFWNFAFPPWPPGTLVEATWPLRRVVLLFANPLDAHSRFFTVLTAWLALGSSALAGLGCLSLAGRRPAFLALLVGPLLLALGAAYGRLYPFHGRLVLFLAPALILLIGEGAGKVAAGRGRWARALVLVLLLAPPAGRFAFRFVQSGRDTAHNNVGDLRSFRTDPDAFPF